ncbi:MAG: hypothetical protein ACI8RN_000056 [Glaciecola sp.]|jgi:hypothetical protein
MIASYTDLLGVTMLFWVLFDNTDSVAWRFKISTHAGSLTVVSPASRFALFATLKTDLERQLVRYHAISDTPMESMSL